MILKDIHKIKLTYSWRGGEFFFCNRGEKFYVKYITESIYGYILL